MKAAILLSALLGARAYAAPDPVALMRSVLPPGFAPVALEVPVFVPVLVPVLTQVQFPGDTQSVALAPLLDRHLSISDSLTGAGGVTLLAATLDLAGDGYFAVTPPGAAPRFIKIERGMSGSWSDGVHAYRVNLSLNIFRARLANFIQIRDMTTGRIVWERRISELLRLTYRVGEPVNIGGRSYRLFYSGRPASGLCFIHDDTSAGGHDYKFYMVPLGQIQGATPVAYKIFGGDVVKLRVSPDLSTLEITR